MTEPLVRTEPDYQNGNGAITYPSELLVPGAREAEQPQGTGIGSGDQHGLAGDTKSQTRIVLGRFFRQPLAIIGLVVFALMGISAVVVGHVWKYGWAQITNTYATGPSWAHPFGTDDIGHDIFAETFRGIEKDIQTALLVAILSAVVGVTIGACAGFFRGWVDSLLMRFVDLILTVPLLAILIVLSNIWASQAGSWFTIAIIIGVLSWTYMARLVRADFLSLREREFVEASRALGASNSRIIVRHLMPNALSTIIVNSTLTIAAAIVIESTLSFLGLGIQAPDVSLGLLVAAAQDSATTQWWLFAFPAAFLVVLIMSVFLIGDGLREAFDPKKTRVRA
ncbi:MAG: ABC transporter permease [Acidimicrobiales bacterium]|jgi:ABC-type dipeptide/oligopeptide/nickel transport system permease subunit